MKSKKSQLSQENVSIVNHFRYISIEKSKMFACEHNMSFLYLRPMRCNVHIMRFLFNNIIFFCNQGSWEKENKGFFVNRQEVSYCKLYYKTAGTMRICSCFWVHLFRKYFFQCASEMTEQWTSWKCKYLLPNKELKNSKMLHDRRLE